MRCGDGYVLWHACADLRRRLDDAYRHYELETPRAAVLIQGKRPLFMHAPWLIPWTQVSATLPPGYRRHACLHDGGRAGAGRRGRAVSVQSAGAMFLEQLSSHTDIAHEGVRAPSALDRGTSVIPAQRRMS